MNLKGIGVAVLAVAVVGALFVLPVAEGAPPQPHNFYGTARLSDGTTFVPQNTRITAFVDGVDYSNGTAVYNAQGRYDVDVFGNWVTQIGQENTPEVKEGADQGEPIMFVAGDMTASGQVFTAAPSWSWGGVNANFDLTLAPTQPALLKIRSITTRPNDPWPQYVYICNPTSNPVDLTSYFLQKDTLNQPQGPRHALTQAVPLIVPPGGLSYVNLTSWDVGGTTLGLGGDNLKLVWDNPGGFGFGGSDIIIDRVEYNATDGTGTLYWQPGNTIMTDAPAPLLPNREIRRSLACGDTNQGSDFTQAGETGRPGANSPPAVTLTTPNGGEDWTGGTPHNVVWDMSDAEDNTLTFAIDLDLNGGADGYPISVNAGSRAEGTGLAFSWTVGNYDTVRARIRICVFDSGGLSACDFSAADFTIDSTGPVLLSTVPPNGATNVDVNADVVLTFDEGMSRAETEASISFSPGPVAFTVTWNGPGTVATVNPTSPLLGNTAYTVTVGCGAQDDSDTGNALQGCPRTFGFQTAGGAVAPTVDLTAPDGGQAWSGNTPHDIVWTMNDADTPGNLAVTLEYSTTGAAGPWTLIANVNRAQGSNTYAWTVACVNTNAARVRVTASDGALTGTDMSAADFRIDCTPPTVLTRTPGPSATQVPLGQNVVIVFSETMARGPTEAAVSITPFVSGIVPSWSQTSVTDDTLTVAHNAFTACTQYTVSIATTARDVSDPGMTLAAPESWTFTTACAPAVTVTAPSGGQVWTGGSSQTVSFDVTDSDSAQARIWVNLSIDNGVTFPYQVYGNPGTIGPTGSVTLPITIPPGVETTAAVLKVTAQDTSGLEGFGLSPAFTIDSTAPTVIASSPADGASNVATDADFTITFSEPMDRAATENAIQLSPAAGTLGFSWSGNTVTVTHSAPLQGGRGYTLTVRATAKDVSTPGNFLAQTTIAFTTAATPLNAVIDGPATAQVGIPVTYDGSRSTPAGAITGYTWEFRDPTGASQFRTGPSVQFTFNRAGTWTVILNITDASGGYDTAELQVAVSEGGGADFLSQYWWVLLILILAIVFAVLFLVLGKRRKKEEHLPEALPPERVETIPPAAPARAPPPPPAPPRPAPPPMPSAPPAPAAPAARPATKECPTCGTIVDAKDTECFMCGSKV